MHYLIDHLTNEMKPTQNIRPLIGTCCIIDLQHSAPAANCTSIRRADKERVIIMLLKAAVVCVLLALFSAGSQGNKEANVYNHHLVARNKRVVRFVGQRTAFRRDSGTCLPDSDEYYRRLDLLLCDEKYIQAVFNEIETSNCTNDYYDTALFYGCGTNDNGDVCAGIGYSTYEDLYDQCDFTSECSSGCRTILRRLSDSVGCCIHNDYAARMPSVWINCNIQQPEVCANTPNIADTLAKKRNVDPCTEKCSQRQLYYVVCKNLGEEYEKLNRECGYEDVIYHCGFDKGEFCAIMDHPTSYLETISDECHSEESNVRDGVCSDNCRNVLKEYIDIVGCCFNFTTARVLSSDLFSACGIEVPNACNSFNSRAVPDDFLECAGRTINNSGATLQPGVYSIGLIIIGLIGTYIYYSI